MFMREGISQSREESRNYPVNGAKTIDYPYGKKKRNSLFTTSLSFSVSLTHTQNQFQWLKYEQKNYTICVRQYKRIFS